ncbi:hypothetical protein RDMS_04860 [Deinococcus sp. RL]|uniref:hypothetical protein n=1 Tax=Deinococcus sp. RL TaxID=1489678 RepID=UPI0004D6E3B6|nr:hypothetical protein [Deinococcus sp. RL]KEF34850.1 hypothetical protein RDMS_04860 [Deinococcus sp. RL]
MRIPEPTYTLATVAPSSAAEFTPGDHALLLAVGEHDWREELIWVQVTHCLQASTHRARTLQTAESFPDLPAGEFIYFRPEHVLQLQPCGARCIGPDGAVLA